MSSYIKSEDITVFPFAKNRAEDALASRLLFEDNIANLIRQMIDVEGFIVSPDNTTERESCCFSDVDKLYISKDLSFNLYGYYFNIKNNAVLSEVPEPGDYVLYASITIDTDSKEISGQDEIVGSTNVFKGLKIDVYPKSETPEVSANTHMLKLMYFTISDSLTVTNSRLCEDSYCKINPLSIDMTISKIDGKHS